MSKISLSVGLSSIDERDNTKHGVDFDYVIRVEEDYFLYKKTSINSRLSNIHVMTFQGGSYILGQSELIDDYKKVLEDVITHEEFKKNEDVILSVATHGNPLIINYAITQNKNNYSITEKFLSKYLEIIMSDLLSINRIEIIQPRPNLPARGNMPARPSSPRYYHKYTFLDGNLMLIKTINTLLKCENDLLPLSKIDEIYNYYKNEINLEPQIVQSVLIPIIDKIFLPHTRRRKINKLLNGK